MTNDPTPNTQKTVAICITALMAWALWLGHNGLLLSGTIAGLAGLGGYEIGKGKLAKIT